VSGSVIRKPEWLKIKIRGGENLHHVKDILDDLRLNTVCQEANCPNKMECFSKHTATFLIMGSTCTRNCRFCDIHPGNPDPIDESEPARVAEAVERMELRYAVITSVTRDDLPDGGSSCFAGTIEAIKERTPLVKIEVLIPDFQGDKSALQTVITASPDIINHNIETVPRLYEKVRPQANYRQSLKLLQQVKELSPVIRTKSGLMVGMGETRKEVENTLADMVESGCDYLTLGQYLPPSINHYPVQEYIHPDVFTSYRDKAIGLGFKAVASGPFVRSSYHAAEMAGE
jgi:lipoyl synthase